ncbi:hypothetical protein ACJRO7_024419 [Eucalyptus globulus]|uniref:Uncharacterized protein n=1 Tax=Eucalyptus globulus TaxID=34317 RepID=A0ABD3KHY2_EUCGL
MEGLGVTGRQLGDGGGGGGGGGGGVAGGDNRFIQRRRRRGCSGAVGGSDHARQAGNEVQRLQLGFREVGDADSGDDGGWQTATGVTRIGSNVSFDVFRPPKL